MSKTKLRDFDCSFDIEQAANFILYDFLLFFLLWIHVIKRKQVLSKTLSSGVCVCVRVRTCMHIHTHTCFDRFVWTFFLIMCLISNWDHLEKPWRKRKETHTHACTHARACMQIWTGLVLNITAHIWRVVPSEDVNTGFFTYCTCNDWVIFFRDVAAAALFHFP